MSGEAADEYIDDQIGRGAPLYISKDTNPQSLEERFNDIITKLENSVEAKTVARMAGRATTNRMVHGEALSALSTAAEEAVRLAEEQLYRAMLDAPSYSDEVGLDIKRTRELEAVRPDLARKIGHWPPLTDSVKGGGDDGRGSNTIRKIVIRLDERIPDSQLSELHREVREAVFQATEKILLEQYKASDTTEVVLEKWTEPAVQPNLSDKEK